MARHTAGVADGAIGVQARVFGDFVEALHSSLTFEEAQANFIDWAGRLLPADAFGVYLLDDRTQEPLAVRTSGVSSRFLARYEEDGRAHDPLLARVASTFDAVSSDLCWHPRAWRREPFYELLASANIHHLMEAPLVVSGRLVGTLNVANPMRGRVFRERELEILRLLARHMSIAYGRAERVAESDARHAVQNELLDVLTIPMVVHDEKGALAFANAAAAELLGRVDLAAACSALRQTATELARTHRRVVTAVIVAPEPRPSDLKTTSATGEIGASKLTVRMSRLPSGGFVSFLYSGPVSVPTPLAVLSEREQEIVELVVRGLSNPEIAAACFVSTNTVKQHLKRVFAKVHVHSRAELAAVAAAGGPVTADAHLAR